MSRIGKLPIAIPKGVKVNLTDNLLTVEGPKGRLTRTLGEHVKCTVADNSLSFELVSKHTGAGAKYGLTRSIVYNMVKGVSEGFTKELEVQGVGYRANASGKTLELSLGFSHPIAYTIPDGIDVKVEKMTKITLTGADKQLVGQAAAEIRRFRAPEPYKGKGIKYVGERIRRKAGKSATATV